MLEFKDEILREHSVAEDARADDESCGRVFGTRRSRRSSLWLLRQRSSLGAYGRYTRISPLAWT